MRKQFRNLSGLEEALEVLGTLAIEADKETVSLADAHGRILADRIDASIDVPGFDRSIMDGYAVRSADTAGAYDDDPVELTYAGKVVPGEEPSLSVDPGEAVEIATGAMLPEGADAVVMVEDTTRDGQTVSLVRPTTPQEHVMTRGTDIASRETVLRRGERLDARRIGLLAAIGIGKVSVIEQPTVGLISTGSEIVRPTEQDRLAVGEIFDINSFSMAAAIEEAGANATIYPHAEDDYEVIKDTFERAAHECDLVVSSGSTSASAEDVVYRIVEDIGELLLHGIAVKPGKPTVFGRLDDTPVLGMPGNPISALMNFRLFVRPLLRSALAERASNIATVEATIAAEMDSVGGRTQLSPVGLVDDPHQGLLAYGVDKGSGAITSLADADGYVTIPANTHYVAAGETETVTLLDERVTYPQALVWGEPCPIVDGAIDRCAADVRYLDVGSVDGLRKLRDGIADLGAIDVHTSQVASFDLDNIEQRRGYDRHLGLLHDGTGSIDTLTDGATVATLPRQTGLANRLEALIEGSGWDVDVRHRPSFGALVDAVAAAEVDAAFTLEAMSESDLTFESITWASFDLFIDRDRQSKEGVQALLHAIDEHLDEDHVGIRRPSDFGEIVTSF